MYICIMIRCIKMGGYYCCVFGCKSTSKDIGVHFHSLPKDYETNTKWKNDVNRPGFMTEKYTKVAILSMLQEEL